MGNDSSPTGATLFDLLDNPSDLEAWPKFVARYGPKIQAWCEQWGLQTSDADDVTQIVITKLWEKMTSTYERGKRRGTGSFRAWLKTITSNVWRDVRRGRRRAGQSGGDALDNQEARDTLWDVVEQEHRRAVLETALVQLRLRLPARDWAIFESLALNGRPVKEVAGEHGMTAAAVYMARSRALAALREEVRLLDPEDAGSGE